jgi:hypothetical protein
VRQRGKEAYKLKLTNKNYNDYNGLESGKEVVGPISAQTLVVWRLGECGDKFTLYPQKFALTSQTSCSRSVGIVCSRTWATEFVLFCYFIATVHMTHFKGSDLTCTNDNSTAFIVCILRYVHRGDRNCESAQ